MEALGSGILLLPLGVFPGGVGIIEQFDGGAGGRDGQVALRHGNGAPVVSPRRTARL